MIGKGHINKRDIAESVVSNVVSAGIGTGVGKIIGKGATKLTAKVANKYASSVVRQAFRKEVKSEIKRTLGTTSGKYAKQLANRMVNRRVSVNRQFDSHLVLFGKNATNYPVQTAIHQWFLMVIQFIKGLLLMAKDFNIYTYPTFFSLLLIMLIPFALSVDDIMNNHQSNMKIILLISVFIIIILIYGLVKTRNRKIVINELGLLITEKEGNMKISWKEISHIFFCSTPIWGLYVKITFTNRRDPLIIDFGKSSLWSVNFYRFRIAILAFSHKKDIIVVKSNQWYLKLI